MEHIYLRKVNIKRIAGSLPLSVSNFLKLRYEILIHFNPVLSFSYVINGMRDIKKEVNNA